MFKTQELLSSAEAAAREAGEILLSFRGRVNPREKAPADLVTEADLAAQEAIERRLLSDFPSFYFIGEEDNSPRPDVDTSDDAWGWIVDPLDGTTNFVHDLDNYCVSIALRHGSEIVLGVILDPVRDHLFHSIRGEGAYRNGHRLHVSVTEALSQSLVAASFSAKVSPDSVEVRRFLKVIHECQAIRRLGSAALNLCYVAEGKLDAYWATSVKIWDVAAGLLCVEEAGGVITSIDGGPLALESPRFLASATPPLQDELLGLLNIGDEDPR